MDNRVVQLISDLKTGPVEIRREAAWQLGGVRTDDGNLNLAFREGVSPLINAFLYEADETVSENACIALQEMWEWSPEIISQLMKELNNENARIRSRAVFIVGVFGEKKVCQELFPITELSLPLIRALLCDSDDEVKKRAGLAIFNIYVNFRFHDRLLEMSSTIPSDLVVRLVEAGKIGDESDSHREIGAAILLHQWRSKPINSIESAIPGAYALLTNMLKPTSGQHKRLRNSLRFFNAFATCGSFSKAAKVLGLEKEGDERHGQVEYHFKRLATILGIDRAPVNGLYCKHASGRYILNEAGQALKGVLAVHPEWLTD